MKAIETFEDGLSAEEKGDWDVALSVYKNLAQQGDERSIEKLVIYYGAAEPNKSELKKWLRVGIKHELPFCLFQYAILVADEDKDMRKAVGYLIRAAQAGDPDSQVMLAKYYLEEEKDIEKFYFYIEKALRQKSQYAADYLCAVESDMEQRLTGLYREVIADRQKQALEDAKRRQKILQKKLRNSFREVGKIFRQKILDNKVHFWRAKD